MMKYIKLLAVVALLTLFIGAVLSSQSNSVVQAQAQKIYKLAIFEDLSSLNTLAVLGPKATVWNFYVRLNGWGPSLFGFSDKFYDYIPGIADASTEEEANKMKTIGADKTATIKIKKGIKWFDPKTGKEVGELTAEDVAFTFNAIGGKLYKGIDPIKMGGNWPGIINPEFFEKAEVVDKYTVKFTLKAQCSYSDWDEGLLFAPIINKAYWEPKFEAASKAADPIKALYEHKGDDEPVVGGWFFQKWEPGAFAESTANKNHYGYGVKSIRPYAGGYTEEKPGVYKYVHTTKIAFPYDGDPGTAILDKDKPTVRLELTTGPFVDAAQWRIYGDQATAVAALIKGDVHILLNPLGVAAGFRKQLRETKGVGIAENAGNGLFYMSFNLRREPFNVKEFRQAVSIMIDREFVTQQLLAGLAIPTYGIVPSVNTAWYNPNIKTLGKGLKEAEKAAQAIELLKKAGFTWEVEPKVDIAGNRVTPGRGLKYKGKAVAPFELLAPHQGYDPLRATFALHIEERLNKIGIPVKVNLTGFNTIANRVFDEQKFDAWILGWGLGGTFPDYLVEFFHSRNSGLGGFNPQGYNNPEYDKIAEEFEKACELSKLKELAFKMQEMLSDELPYVPLFNAPLFEAYRADVIVGERMPYEKVLDGIQGVNGHLSYIQLK
ncbi:MAG: ABC transporter substrate-binding protein [Candidatus Bipolaricaulota bacterium]|nr:ABC transporter substrate-binding protein [Candidatus Bipolaricaulota bacterium]MDW8030295.1 ABC transporter substrate-binding protein [Candidatus Bipolaricaulota bacterium]